MHTKNLIKKKDILYGLIFILIVSLVYISCGGDGGSSGSGSGGKGDESGVPAQPETPVGPIDINQLLAGTSAAEVGVVLARSTGIDDPLYIKDYVNNELGLPLTLSDVKNCNLKISNIPDLDCNAVPGTQADAGILLAILQQIQSPYAVSNYVNNQLGITVPLLSNCPLPAMEKQPVLGRLTLWPKKVIVNEATLLNVNIKTTALGSDSELELLQLTLSFPP